MNEDQIQKFINACKNAGFEVGEAKEIGVLRTRITLSGNVMILRREYSSDHTTFKLYVDGRSASIEDFKPLIASYLMKAMKIHLPGITLRGLANCDKWEVSDIGVQISLADEPEDVIFEAFCEVYQ